MANLSNKTATPHRRHIKVNSAPVSIYAGKLQNRICIEVRLTAKQEESLLAMLQPSRLEHLVALKPMTLL